MALRQPVERGDMGDHEIIDVEVVVDRGGTGYLVRESSMRSAFLAGREPGFKARHSDLANIIRSAWAWHQEAHPRRA